MLLDSGLDLAGGHNHVDGDIVIEDDVWVGAGAIVLPNVVLGRGCVVGAGSVVTRSVPPGCVYAGNPARFLKMISS
nr:DapH/DapD/GlmU-related protein [Arenimonas caeni]